MEHLVKLIALILGISMMVGSMASPLVYGLGAFIIFLIGWYMTEEAYKSIFTKPVPVKKKKKKRIEDDD